MIKVGQTTTNQTIALPYELTNDGDTSILLNELKGNTTQNGTPTPTSPQQVNVVKGNKNILDNTQGTTQTINGITFTKNSDGTLTANGTATAGVTYYVNGSDSRWQQIPPATYVLSDGTSSPSSSTYFTYLDIQGQDGLYLSTMSTKTRTYSSYYNCRARIVVRNGVTLNNLVFKVQLEQGSTATSYTPYNTIQAKVVGKNLFDKNNYTNVSGNIGFDVSNLTIGVTYTFSSNMPINRIKISDGVYGASSIDKVDANGFKTYAFTMTRNSNIPAGHTQYLFFKLDSSAWLTDISQLDGFTFQIEQGATATTYEAYKSNNYPLTLGDIELCKIGTYQDRIYKNNGKWYLEKQIGKVVLNGSESWEMESSGQRYKTWVSTSRSESLRNIIYSNYFHYISSGNEVGGGFNFNQLIYLYPNNITSVADLKTWLGTHNTIVYYMLQTPTTTEITDETLLEQLEAIGELYRGTNNIMITDTIAPVENIIIEKSNAEFDLVPYIKREPKLDYIDRKGDTGYTADGHYFENIIARKRGLEFELIPMSQDNYINVISHFIDKTQIPVYLDDLFTGETNLIQTYKKEKIPTKQITENGIVRGTTIKLEEI